MIFWGSRPALLRNPIFCGFQGGGSGPPVHPSGSVNGVWDPLDPLVRSSGPMIDP